MNDSYAKLNAVEAKAAAMRKIVSINEMREGRIASAIQKRIARNAAINEKWWWLWPRPITKDGVTEEIAREDFFGVAFVYEKCLWSKEESLCQDVITLANASCDGFVWLTPGHIRAVFCSV